MTDNDSTPDSAPGVTPFDAVLFDIDGTLVDSNYLHIQAWSATFDELEAPVDTWRIHRGIGLDSGKLLDALLDDQADELGERAKARHAKRYHALAGRLRLFKGARELLAEIHKRGRKVVLATSAPQDELDLLLPLLNADKWVDAVTSAEDAETAKPDPDIIQIAVDKAGVSADRAVLIGDSVWDGQSAGKAGVAFIGMRSGGFGDDELRDAGAIAIFDSPDDLLQHLDDGPLAGRF